MVVSSPAALRVALLVSNSFERGSYWRAFYLARELAARGHYATLMFTHPHARQQFHVAYAVQNRLALVGAPDLLKGSLRSGWDVFAALARAHWLRAARFDLIHAFECRPSVILPALLARRRTAAPLIIDWCDWFGAGGSVEERPSKLQRSLLRPVETFFEERFRPLADATTVINEVLARKAMALGVEAVTITRFYNGCDTTDWPGDSRAEARQRLDLPQMTPLIAYSGSIFQRDAVLLAQAFDMVQAALPQARLLVLGYCNVALEDMVAQPSAVLRTGPLDTLTLRRYLRAADLGWAPLSDSGANRGRFPLKISTYMEAGLPFVTTAVGDLGDFVQRYPAGIATPPYAEAVAAATRALLNDSARSASLGTHGRWLAENELSWTTVSGTVERLYRRVLAADRREEQSVSGSEKSDTITRK
jgi:glycosyltransferase involved in cell wall biosynthesis